METALCNQAITANLVLPPLHCIVQTKLLCDHNSIAGAIHANAMSLTLVIITDVIVCVWDLCPQNDVSRAATKGL